MIGWRTITAAIVGVAATIALFWLTDVPLGVPGEWVWNRLSDEPTVDTVVNWAIAVITGGAYCGFAWWAAGRIERASRLGVAGLQALLVLAGFAWLFFVQETPPAGYRLSKQPYVLYDRGASGYFFEARYGGWEVSDFLQSYEARLEKGDVLHMGTHPPGLFLFHRGINRLCESSPALTSAVLQTVPQSAEDMFELIDTDLRGANPPLAPADRAALWLAACAIQLAGVCTVVPLYFLARLHHARGPSWLASSLWPLVPALSVFLPKSDVLHAFTGTVFLCTWLWALHRRSILLAAIAGCVLFAGMFLSLAILPVGLLAALLTGWELFVAKSDGERFTIGAGLKLVAAALVPFVAFLLVMQFAFHVNMLNVWRWNLRNHAGFYEAYTRTYWKWLLVNPLELCLAIGLPAVVLVGVSAWRNARQGERGSLGPYVCCAAVWALLWLSGKNMGEAARLWLVIQPWFVWRAAAAFAPAPSKGAVVLLALQAAVTIVTVARVTGFFHF